MVKIKDPSTKKTEVNTVSIGPSKPNSNDYKEIKEDINHGPNVPGQNVETQQALINGDTQRVKVGFNDARGP